MAPQYIPREVQQEAFRRIVKRHQDLMNGAFVKATRELTRLALRSDSEKVRLAAIQEILNRTVGRVPEKIAITGSEPWVEHLADAIQPLSEVLALAPYSDVVEGEVVEDGAGEMPRAGVEPRRAAATGESAPPARGRPRAGVEKVEMPATDEEFF
jgi:hypothetical protein